MSIDYLNTIWSNSNKILKKKNLYREILSYNRSYCSDMIDFSSNDYLNLRNDSRIIQAGSDAAMQNGAGTGASRSVLQTDARIDQLESFFCANFGYKYALFLPSGFLANTTFFDVLSAFGSENIEQEIFIDHRAHVSLFFGLKSANLRSFFFRHNDYDFLEKKLSLSKSKAKIIVVESLYSMDGDFSDADALFNLCKRYNALLFIDETHTLGVYGERGTGFAKTHKKLKPFIVASVFGCGKAVGVSGGFLATDSFEFKERALQKSKVFMYSTGISPFISGAVQKSLEIILSDEGEAKRRQLNGNIDFFKNIIPHITSPIVPIVISGNERVLQVSNLLLQNNIIARAIRSPSIPKGSERIRIVLNSAHSFSQIEKLMHCLQSEKQQNPKQQSAQRFLELV